MRTLKRLLAIAVANPVRDWENMSILMQAAIKPTDGGKLQYFKGLHLAPDERFFADIVRPLLSFKEEFTFAKLTDLHRIA